MADLTQAEREEIAEEIKQRFDDLFAERDHYKQRVEELTAERDDWKHRAERGEVSGWKGRAESAEQRLGAVREWAEGGRPDTFGDPFQVAQQMILSLLDQTDDHSTPEKECNCMVSRSQVTGVRKRLRNPNCPVHGEG